MPDDLRKVRTGDTVTIPASAYNELMDVAAAWRSGAIPRSGTKGSPIAAARSLVPFRITDVVVLTEGRRWKLIGDQQTGVPTIAAADGYAKKTGGITDAEIYCIGEERNDQSGQYEDFFGNGLPASSPVTLGPVPIGRVVMCWREPVNGGYEWRCDAPNTGECESGENTDPFFDLS